MNRLGDKIRDYINDRKSKRIYRVTAVILSFVVVFSVAVSLILPAISATQFPDSEIDTTYLAKSGVTDFSDFDDENKSNAFDLKNSIKSLEFEKTSSDGNTVVGSFSMTYDVKEKNVLSSQCPYLYVQLPDNVEIPSDLVGDIVDGSKITGSFIIEKDTGLVKIKIKEEFFDDYKNGFTGTLNFNATVKRIDTEYGSSSNIQIGNQFVTVEGFTPKALTMSKSGVNNEDGTISWTIIVDNPMNENLGDFTLSDTMFDSGRAESVIVEPSSAGSYDSESRKFTFTNEATDKRVTITYTTKLTDEETYAPREDWGDYGRWDGKITNSASFKKNDGSDPIDKTIDVNYKIGYNLSKEGNADYENNTINWKLTITNKYNRPLNNFKIKDTMLSQYFGDDISNITFSPSSVTGTLSGDTITLDSGDYTGDVVITYSTPAEKGVTYKNQAELDNPKDQPIGDKPSVEVSFTPATMKKSHTEDRENKLIEWTIEINNNRGNPENLNKYYIVDEMLKNAVGEIKILNNNSILDEKYYTVDKDNGKITFDGFTEDCEINNIKIVYSTNPYDGNPNSTNTEYTNTNTVDLYNGNGDKDISSTDTDTWISTNSIEKKHGEAKLDEENGIMTIPWTITIEQEAGKFKGLNLKDIMLANDSENVDLHYITPDQLKAITIIDFTNKNPLSADCYTITESDVNLKSFDIIFKNDEALDDVTKIVISYETTAVIGDVEKGQTVIFDNKATFNGKESKDPLPYENVDTSKTPYKKYDGSISIDQQTTGTTSKSIGQFEKVTVDGVEYYKFDYIITVDKSKYKDAYTLIDTLPDGFTLYGDIMGTWGSYDSVISANSGYTYYNYDEDNGILKFVVTSNDCKLLDKLTYSLKVNAKEFDEKLKAGSVSVENKLKDESGKYDEVTQIQKFEESVLTKSLSSEKQAAGYIEYEIKVNPEGADLSRDNSLVLTDVIKAHTYADSTPCNDPGGINIYLDSIEVYHIGGGANGEDVKLDSSKYSYVLDNNPPVSTETHDATISEIYARSDNYYYVYRISGVPEGSSGKIILKKNSAGQPDGWVGTGNDSAQNIVSYNSNIFGDSDTFTINVDSSQTDGSDIFVVMGTNDYTVESAAFSSGEVHPYAAKLTMTVPDSTPLRIVYRYLGRRPEGSDKDDSVGAVNTVSVNTAIKTEQSYIDSKFELTSSQQGTIKGKETFRIKKVDVGDYSILLNAAFNLYKWDGSSWLPATALGKELDDNQNETDINKVNTWGSSDDTPADINVSKDSRYDIHLDNDVLYKIVEKTAPDGYEKLSEPRYFSVGVLPTGVSFPDEAKNYTVVSNGGNLNIQNYKKISVKAQKSWADGNENHSEDTVTVQLYKSTTNMIEGLPDNLEPVENSQVTLGAANDWSCTWNDLPNGTEAGLPLYYYVKEISYTIGGESFTVDGENSGEYKPYYIGNSLNVSNTVSIINTAGLVVEKSWQTYDNQDGIPAAEFIEFQIYRSTTQQIDGTLPNDAVLWKPDKFELSPSNNWNMVFKDGIEPTDANGNQYYYYVVETTQLADNKVSYIGNGSGSTGLITITNKSTKIVIGHMPETGSIGTVWFFIAGGVLALGALAALRMLRRHLSDQS